MGFRSKLLETLLSAHLHISWIKGKFIPNSSVTEIIFYFIDRTALK